MRIVNRIVLLISFVGLVGGLSPSGLFAKSNDGDYYHDRPDTSLTIPDEKYYQPEGKPAPEGQEIRKFANPDTAYGRSYFHVEPLHDDPYFATVSFDRLEIRSSEEEDENVHLWDMQAWAGRDDVKLYLESEGEQENGASEPESGQLDLLYGRTVSAYWEARFGIRQTIEPNPARTFAVLGATGIAPQWFETKTNFLVGESDDIRADLELEYELLLGQRLIFQPRFESQFSFQEQPELDLGDGFTDIEVGGRLRYELSRKLAPYLGVSWESSLGETKDIVERSGGQPDHFFVVGGLRFWY